MVVISQMFEPLKDWCSGILNADRWEAPERGFIGHRDILVQSRARYEFVAPHVRGSLLDVGCGRGYGFEFLATRTNAQIGIDISLRFMTEAKKVYPRPFFVCGKGDAIPLANHSVDSIIAFEVIEHAENGQLFLEELRRVAREDALIAISTPNMIVSSAGSDTPLNRFHHHEYKVDEFRDLLNRVFSSVQLFGQRERLHSTNSRNIIIDRIPIRWKYYLPHLIQTLASIVVRPPLRLDECEFQTDSLDVASTFLALCRP